MLTDDLVYVKLRLSFNKKKVLEENRRPFTFMEYYVVLYYLLASLIRAFLPTKLRK
jgi:hypothetical protein